MPIGIFTPQGMAKGHVMASVLLLKEQQLEPAFNLWIIIVYQQVKICLIGFQQQEGYQILISDFHHNVIIIANKKFLAKRFNLSARVDHLQEKHCLLVIEDGKIRAKPISSSSLYKDYKIF